MSQFVTPIPVDINFIKSILPKGAFFRGDANFDPPPELSDDAAVAAVKGVYRPGLEAIKKLAEAQ